MVQMIGWLRHQQGDEPLSDDDAGYRRLIGYDKPVNFVDDE